jgi:hypothetical protein
MKINRCKNDPLLQEMKDFLKLYREVRYNNFRKGLLRLRDGFVTVNEREKPQKIQEFRIALEHLISKVKQMQERGLWRKYHFNIFETLEYQRREDTHSNLLAWLLNPEESHGIGDIFLRTFVQKVFNIKDLPIN